MFGNIMNEETDHWNPMSSNPIIPPNSVQDDIDLENEETHMHTQHTHATTHSTHTHNTSRTHTHASKKMREKEGNLFKSSFFRSWSCYLCQTHLLSSKGRVQLHGGAANWWSCYSRVGLVEPEPSQTCHLTLIFNVCMHFKRM
jgi:hypothetical protein